MTQNNPLTDQFICTAIKDVNGFSHLPNLLISNSFLRNIQGGTSDRCHFNNFIYRFYP